MKLVRGMPNYPSQGGSDHERKAAASCPSVMLLSTTPQGKQGKAYFKA
jgi:hypothetical protein